MVLNIFHSVYCFLGLRPTYLLQISHIFYTHSVLGYLKKDLILCWDGINKARLKWTQSDVFSCLLHYFMSGRIVAIQWQCCVCKYNHEGTLCQWMTKDTEEVRYPQQPCQIVTGGNTSLTGIFSFSVHLASSEKPGLKND